METSIQDHLENYYSQHQQKNKAFSIRRNSPNFQVLSDLNIGNIHTRGENNTDQDFYNRSVTPERLLLSSMDHSVKSADLLSSRYKTDNELLRAQLISLENEKKIHVENHAQQKEAFQQKIALFSQKLQHQKFCSNREIFCLKEECQVLKKDVERLKAKGVQRVQFYKKKYQALEDTYSQAIKERDAVIKNLKSKLRLRESEKTSVRKSRKNVTPFRTFSGAETQRTRTPQPSRLDDISQMIVSLEKSQAEYRQKYHSLLKMGEASSTEIQRLSLLLNSNEKRLQDAKKLQEYMIKTSLKL